jgi:NAD(P)H-hydrate epimerase
MLPNQLYSAEQVRALDRCAIEEFKTPGIDLMERAGSAVFRAMRQRWPRAHRLAVFCGGGNNGGDGFVIARLAKEAGLDVTAYLLEDASRLKGDAKSAYDKMTKVAVPVIPDAGEYDSNNDEPLDIIVDAMLGTGLSGPVEGRWEIAIHWINQQKDNFRVKVVAADIPSGLHADTGCVLGDAVRADLTVTFIGVKMGMLTAMGPDHCGELVFDDLQIEAQVYQGVAASALRLDDKLIKTVFPKRKQYSHKGSYGHVLILGGNYGMAGAVRLAGEAALRCGAGRVSIACRTEHVTAVVANRPELMCHGLDENPKLLTAKLKSLMSSANCIVIGPGLGQDKWAQQIFSVIRQSSLPLIVDADALNLLARDFDGKQRNNWLLTPHPGEASRLLQTTTLDIQSDRFNAIKALQSRYGGIIVLKGNGSLVIDSQGAIYVCTAGNPGMGSAGMGDVLSGALAACVSQSGQLDLSAQVATLVHALAADLAVENVDERGLIASDLFPYLRQLVNPASDAQ